MPVAITCGILVVKDSFSSIKTRFAVVKLIRRRLYFGLATVKFMISYCIPEVISFSVDLLSLG